MKNKSTKLSGTRVLGLQFLLYITMLWLLSFVLAGCEDTCEVETTYTYYEPVYTPLSELRQAVAVETATSIKAAGKIFFKGNFLFVNEPNEGIHVIDNSNPADPENIAFINVPGSFDIAVKGNLLYSDSYIDLVVIDISDISNAKEVTRIENVFSNYNSYGYYVDASQGVVTNWKEVEQVNITESECGQGHMDWGLMYDGGIALAETSNFNANIAVSPTNPGMAGSMARFALAHDHLYVIDDNSLIPFSLESADQPLSGERQYIAGGIETLFPSGANLFMGAQNGMHIMDLSNPMNPTLISTYNHINSCDPVIVDGDYAFVTLRSGNQCAGFTNQLEVINISDLTNPEVEHVYGMTNPHGLGKDGDALFICDGEDGLKIYNAADLGEISSHLLAHYKDIQAFDIIPYNKTAMMIGEGGLYQYDYTDLNDIRLLSHINIGE